MGEWRLMGGGGQAKGQEPGGLAQWRGEGPGPEAWEGEALCTLLPCPTHVAHRFVLIAYSPRKRLPSGNFLPTQRVGPWLAASVILLATTHTPAAEQPTKKTPSLESTLPGKGPSG